MSDRPLSRCAECGQTDDHPKHQELSPGEPDGCLYHHMDCHAEADCHNGTCAAIIAHAGDKRGLDLLDHIQKHVVPGGKLGHLIPGGK